MHALNHAPELIRALEVLVLQRHRQIAATSDKKRQRKLEADADKYDTLATWVRESKKFVLHDPTGYNDKESIAGAKKALALMRAPFPVILLETTISLEDDKARCTFLIIDLCEQNRDDEIVATLFDTLESGKDQRMVALGVFNSFVIFPFIYVEDLKGDGNYAPINWVPLGQFGYIPKNQESGWHFAVREHYINPSDPILVAPVTFGNIDWMGEDAYQDQEDFDQHRAVLLNSSLLCFHFLRLANCTNIRPEVVVSQESLRKLNAKRAKKGRPPLFEYWGLRVDSARQRKHNASLGGTHASPRQHYRRGHMRLLPSGRETWVRPALVGNAVNGVIEKDWIF